MPADTACMPTADADIGAGPTTSGRSGEGGACRPTADGDRGAGPTMHASCSSQNMVGMHHTSYGAGAVDTSLQKMVGLQGGKFRYLPFSTICIAKGEKALKNCSHTMQYTATD